ncbi:MAG: response regulator [Candidatus Coatesbacteria bacterium]|nr:response regulator [Candidatus Coatesbacteria bacterium]
MEKNRILWVDDEIELLRSHLMYLRRRDYDVVGVTNGDDALTAVLEQRFDLVLLDEHMMGLTGTETLAELKRVRPELPVVMVTKGEEETLMNEAYGLAADDFVVKPVKPSQLVSVLKRILEARALETATMVERYMKELRQLEFSRDELDHVDDWLERYLSLVKWDIKLEDARDPGLFDLHHQVLREDNAHFARYIIRHYRDWTAEDAERPMMAPDILPRVVAPFITGERPVFFVVIDAMRYDCWLLFRRLLEADWLIDDFPYLSIIPTSTNYARNAIFAGLFPAQIAERYPDYWQERSEEDASLNKHESDLMRACLDRLGVRLTHKTRYKKARGTSADADIAELFRGWRDPTLYAMVINFVDVLTHERAYFDVLSEMSDTPQSFRTVAAAWFAHSQLLAGLKELARRDVTVVITTDHGSVQTRRAVIAYCDKRTTKGLRLWFGQNLRYEGEGALLIDRPNEWMLPAETIGKNYLIALEDYNFVYSYRQHEQRRFYAGAFQHGGLSMQEMIIPCAVLHPKRHR